MAKAMKENKKIRIRNNTNSKSRYIKAWKPTKLKENVKKNKRKKPINFLH